MQTKIAVSPVGYTKTLTPGKRTRSPSEALSF